MKRENNDDVPCIDIGQGSIKILCGDRGLEIPIDRNGGNALEGSSGDHVVEEFRRFLDAAGRRPRHARCALPARGVSLRMLDLPPAGRDGTDRLVRLQVEKEFPLAPEDLAWGYRDHGQNGTGKRHLSVMAVKRAVIDEYSQLLSRCGIQGVFSVGLLATHPLCKGADNFCVLDVGGTHSQLAHFAGGIPCSVRTLPWGGETVTQAIARSLEIDRDQAERRKCDSTSKKHDKKLDVAVNEALEKLAKLIGNAWPKGPRGSNPSESSNSLPELPRVLFLTGRGARLQGLKPALGRFLGGDIDCQTLDVPEQPGHSSVTLGLRESGADVLEFQLTEPAQTGSPVDRRLHWTWGSAIAALAITWLALQIIPPLRGIPRLEERMGAVQQQLDQRPSYEREASFLEELDRHQLPTLDALTLVTAYAPKGMFLDAFALDQRRVVTFTASLKTSKQAHDLCSKLEDSKWFSSVFVEELAAQKNKRWKLRVTAPLAAPLPPLPELPKLPEKKPTVGAKPTPAAAGAKVNAVTPPTGAATVTKPPVAGESALKSPPSAPPTNTTQAATPTSQPIAPNSRPGTGGGG